MPAVSKGGGRQCFGLTYLLYGQHAGGQDRDGLGEGLELGFVDRGRLRVDVAAAEVILKVSGADGDHYCSPA